MFILTGTQNVSSTGGQNETKTTFDLSVWLSKVYKYMDSRATEKLTKGIVEALEKSRHCILHATAEPPAL